MNTIIDNRTAALPDRIRLASRRPKTLGSAVPGSISLAMGEPDGDTPQTVVAAARRALSEGRTRYSQITGSPDLRRALAGHLSATTGNDIGSANVVLTHGGSAGLAATIMALVSPGDRVLIPEPSYSLYADHIAMVGGTAEWIPNLPDGHLDLTQLAAAAGDARMIILCNPVNPTGGVFGAEDLAGLSRILANNPELYLLSDEAYSDIIFDDLTFNSAVTLESSLSQVILAGTFSKSYAMTGWRLGFIAAAEEIADAINLVHRTINGPLSTFIQDAAIEALRIPERELHTLALGYQRRRDLVLKYLDGINGLSVARPEGAFYAFPRIRSKLNSEQLTARFAEGGVLVRAGSEFGVSGEGHVRLSFATDDESLEEGLRRFVAVVQELEAPNE
ncbi:pyridoxal phosphate-dependent aminotransferase [Leifsonia sp. 2MCAF36]|uniref:pyridoxal phosphate-dependent aminotransferase n=1 Tax=Leifsonia sp. 2MCAF36 TaxID=3232988 RepID=UPI003F990666